MPTSGLPAHCKSSVGAGLLPASFFSSLGVVMGSNYGSNRSRSCAGSFLYLVLGLTPVLSLSSPVVPSCFVTVNNVKRYIPCASQSQTVKPYKFPKLVRKHIQNQAGKK